MNHINTKKLRKNCSEMSDSLNEVELRINIMKYIAHTYTYDEVSDPLTEVKLRINIMKYHI
jgi:hypothetical protein